MTLKGYVSSIQTEGVRVTFPDRDSIVSRPLKKATHIGDLAVDDEVIVAFPSGSLSDGYIIALIE